ncbi:MAG: hypothetical protein C0613_08590 [Desulfobulbaceae bacterium]|nr:MAG: hypothetical protein C0613_08590 [Desulfobulbaceae bacterium]
MFFFANLTLPTTLTARNFVIFSLFRFKHEDIRGKCFADRHAPALCAVTKRETRHGTGQDQTKNQIAADCKIKIMGY